VDDFDGQGTATKMKLAQLVLIHKPSAMMVDFGR